MAISSQQFIFPKAVSGVFVEFVPLSRTLASTLSLNVIPLLMIPYAVDACIAVLSNLSVHPDTQA